MWTTITEAKVIAKLSGPEIAAMKTAALQAAQSNPLTEIIAQVVLEVRGYIAACPNNILGEGTTIPEELLGAAVSRVRFELATRLPVATLLTEDRRSANRDAIRLLEQVAACKFLIVQPETAAPEQAGGPAVQAVSTTTKRYGRSNLSGL